MSIVGVCVQSVLYEIRFVRHDGCVRLNCIVHTYICVSLWAYTFEVHHAQIDLCVSVGVSI